MATITPILDTLLPQVFGRLGDLERFSATRVNNPLSAITAITSDGDGARRGAELARTSIGRQTNVAAARGQSATQTAAKTVAEPAPAPAGPGAADVWSGYGHISRAGAVLAALFQRFPAAPKSAATTAGPLLTGDTAPQPAALAAILASQVGQSGVFYEAHLLQWFEGRRALSQMRAESASRRQAPRFDGPAAVSSHDGDGPVDERLLPVVRQQLDALQHGIFRWQGHAWPGVAMAWQIESGGPCGDGHNGDEGGDREPGDAAAQGAAEHATSLRLAMPTLGTLEIRVTLAENQVRVYAWADSAPGARMLDADGSTLQCRLQDLGFDGASVKIVDGTP